MFCGELKRLWKCQFYKFPCVTSGGFWEMNLNEAPNFILMTLRRQWVLLLHINDGLQRKRGWLQLIVVTWSRQTNMFY